MSDKKGQVHDEGETLSRGRAFKGVIAYAKPHRWTFAVIFICTLFAISADLLQPYLMKVAIDDHLMSDSGEMGSLIVLGVAYLGFALISLVFTYLQNNLLQYAGQSIVARIRKDLFEHISKQSMAFFDRFPIGSLVTHESSDTETISQFFTQVFLSLMRDGMTLILILFFMFQLDATLAWYSMILMPIIGVIAVLFRTKLRRAYQQSRSRLSRLIAFLAENLAGMSLIQSFNQEKEQVEQYTEKNKSYFRANLREIRTNVMFNRSFDILGNMSVAFIAWIGGMAVLNKSLEFGVLYAFIIYIRQFFQPINQITQQWNTFQSTMVSVDRLWRIFSTEPEIQDAKEGERRKLRLDEVQGRIDFDRIQFSYEPGVPVIRQLSLRIHPGEMIGVVGTTGAGKSSMISLLNRFYDVDEGSIRIDGINIRRIPQADLHRMVGLVQQEPYLFSGSIVDNVRLFRQDISRDQVIEACRFVGAHPMIMRLQHGYDSRLSERGSGLSAGERQLISFARIVVFQPKILILDEATANLDSHTEQLIQRALDVVSSGRTTIVIAHRLSTVMHASRIIVMKKGQIVECGTHQELIEQRGYYEELYRHSHGYQQVADRIS